MPNIDYQNSLSTAGQFPLNGKTRFKTIQELTDLGAGNFKAFKYQEDMIVQCIENHTQYIWREVLPSETGGLLPSSFTYPPGAIADGIDYSNRTFNFFEYTLGDDTQNNKIREVELNFFGFSEITIQDVVDKINSLPLPLVVKEDENVVFVVNKFTES